MPAARSRGDRTCYLYQNFPNESISLCIRISPIAVSQSLTPEYKERKQRHRRHTRRPSNARGNASSSSSAWRQRRDAPPTARRTLIVDSHLQPQSRCIRNGAAASLLCRSRPPIAAPIEPIEEDSDMTGSSGSLASSPSTGVLVMIPALSTVLQATRRSRPRAIVAGGTEP